jgi:hypothetical protein
VKTSLQVTKDGIRATDIFISMPSIGDGIGNGTVSPNDALNFKLSMKVDTSRGVGGKAVGLLTTMNGPPAGPRLRRQPRAFPLPSPGPLPNPSSLLTSTD